MAGRDERGGRAPRPRPRGRTSPAATLLRVWLLLTAALLTGGLLWAFAPLLIFFGLLAAALGIVAALMIALARALRTLWRDEQPNPRTGNGTSL